MVIIDLRKQYDGGELNLATLSALRDDFDLRLLQLLVAPRANAANQRLSNHLWNHFDGWFTFLCEPLAETTNNRAERAIRPAVVNRKVWGGNRPSAIGPHERAADLPPSSCQRR